MHGDYHLGQVLWAEGDFYILDFEGEPARPLAERRAEAVAAEGRRRHAALVQLRGLRRAVRPRRDAPGRVRAARAVGTHLADLGDARRSCAAISTAAGDAPFLPADLAQRDALLQLFVLDKALYELNYELNNRPDWVRIPLTAILGIIGGE